MKLSRPTPTSPLHRPDLRPSATYLISASLWVAPPLSNEEIDRLIDEEETVRVPVTEQLPVAVVYWTAFVSEDGAMNFRNDVYGRDDRLKAALRGAGGSDEPARPVEACGM